MSLPPEPPTAAAEAISLSHISKSFTPDHPAVADLSLEIGHGEFLAVVGGSGSGKTTLLRMINRLIEPDSGKLRVLGAEPDLRPHLWRRRIGYVFQGVGLFPHMTVAENIAATPRLLGWTPDEIEARVVELLDLVGLPASAYGGRTPDRLSGGQRQRVGVARALAARPPVMLMDEPFGALDPLTRDELGRAYRRLHDQLGLTTVMVTHDMTEALLLADRIAVMHAGRLLAAASPTALAESNDPYIVDLLEVPRRQSQRVADALAGNAADG